MGNLGKNLPFHLEKIDEIEYLNRENILRHYPGGIDGISLKRLQTVLRVGALRLHIKGIEQHPHGLPSDCVPIAVSADHTRKSDRCVLAISSELADQIINLTLGRARRPKDASLFLDEHLLSGEKGVLLFALDAAAGDWKDHGGGRFVINGLLYDGDQIPDYLQRRPDWSVWADVVGEGARGRIWLFFCDPVRVTGSLKQNDIGDRARRWCLPFAVTVGNTRLRASEVTALSVGDRILLDGWNCPSAEGGNEISLITAGKWHRFGRWLDTRHIEVISMEERVLEMDKTGDHNILRTVLEPSESDEGEMSVTVTVEVGSFRTTVRRAAALVPGRILALDRPVGPEVTLKVAGKVVGKGVLMDLEGTMAVEVKEVSV